MNDFNNVMAAEKEAEQAILTAKEEVAEAITVAELDHRSQIETEGERLSKSDALADVEYQSRVKDMVKIINSETDVQISAVETNFESLNPTLKAKLSAYFR